MPGSCTICGRVYCDHTRKERGLTPEQWKSDFQRELTAEELRALESGDSDAKIRAARIAASRLYGGIYSFPGGGVVGL